jgi:hypothetical protein
MEEIDSAAASVFSPLKTVLSKVSPIESWKVSLTPTGPFESAPSIWWSFFRPEPEMLGRLSRAVDDYHGDVTWMLAPAGEGSGYYLVATRRKTSPFVGYPPIALDQEVIARRQPQRVSREFLDAALADVPKLGSYLDRVLGLSAIRPKEFEARMIAPPEPPSLSEMPADFVERGVHTARIVGRQGAGQPADTTRMLHFSVTLDEWLGIHTDVFGAQQKSATLPAKAALFPLLFEIEEFDGAYFKGTEVEAFRKECVAARANVSNPVTIRGLDKLILMCNWAIHMGGDLSLDAP